MKKIIDGKVYNTETAKLLGEWENEYFSNDFHYCHEALYITKKGQYFIYGSGGALSKYSEPCANGSTGGSDLILLSDTDAKEYAEEHFSADTYIEIFGEIEEG